MASESVCKGAGRAKVTMHAEQHSQLVDASNENSRWYCDGSDSLRTRRSVFFLRLTSLRIVYVRCICGGCWMVRARLPTWPTSGRIPLRKNSCTCDIGIRCCVFWPCQNKAVSVSNNSERERQQQRRRSGAMGSFFIISAPDTPELLGRRRAADRCYCAGCHCHWRPDEVEGVRTMKRLPSLATADCFQSFLASSSGRTGRFALAAEGWPRAWCQSPSPSLRSHRPSQRAR